MTPQESQIWANADALPERPVAVEAYWDGDSTGWLVRLSAVLPSASGFREGFLGSLRDGGDMRIFNGQVPPWSEAITASKLGSELAAKFGVPFYFPSPHHPEEDCPRWWEQARGEPCRRCGIPLLQQELCPWRGVCYFCHLAEKREQKEAVWTPEQRAAPRCHLCGDPAPGLTGPTAMCAKCNDQYETYECTKCGEIGMRSKTAAFEDCRTCRLAALFQTVSAEHRRAIRQEFERAGEFGALRMAKQCLGWPLNDALAAVHVFCKQAP